MKFYHSKLLKNFTNLIHCFTTRDVGNLAFHVGDNPRHVDVNHLNLASLMRYDKDRLIHMKQIHSNDVHLVDEHDNFHMPYSCDALITNLKDTPLMVMVADCSPILFYDITQKVVAVAHAGREGTFKNIVKNVVESMACAFESNPKDIVVSIGASIGVCCYEVGAEIYEKAKELNLEYAIEIKENSYYLDISKILKKQLMACGIKEQNIEISNECTCCNANHKYFSYRADGVTGRFAGVLMLKS